ncbi:serine hydrolase [Cryptosporangium japonicum]|uniref:Serine hydrolase n=1 Tax=Cryptosporangium japonicum TaxID=80872 RepID=A0ABP3DRL5_9ACTN
MNIADVVVPSQPALSADGTLVAYVLRTIDTEHDRNVDQLWLVGTDGGTPRRLTNGPADTAPSWAPDGRRLAFLRDGQLAVLDLDGGEPERLTDLPRGAGAPRWSPDGTRLAFVAPVGDTGGPMVSDGLDYQADGAGLYGAVRRHLHVVDVASGDVRRLTDGAQDVGAVAWSPDSATLAFTQRHGADSDLRHRTPVFLLDVDAAHARPRLRAFADGVAATVGWAGSALLVTGWTGDPRGHARLYRVDDEVTELAADVDRNVMPGAPAYPGGLPHAADGRVYFCLRDHGCTHLWSVALDGGDARPVVDGAGRVVSGLSIAAGRAAITLATPTSYGEIVVVDLATGAETALTANQVELHRREERWFSISDGTRVQAWLLRDPAATGPQPLVLDIHGGPHNAWNAAADEMHLYHQDLVDQGWAVLLINPRGSDGYGEAFYDSINGGWGLADGADFLEPIDQLVAEGFADADRLAVTGYSYGGFMTCWLTAHDYRFAVAVAGGTVSDLVSISGSSDDAHFLSVYELGGAPWQKPAEYAAMSPLTHVADVRTPTLLLHGADDLTCPVGQAQQWHTALRQLGVPTRLVVYPGASHAFVLLGPPSQRVDYGRRLVDWITEHTTGRARVDAAHWQQRLARLADRHRVPGAQLGILSGDQLVELAHGVLHTGTGAPVRTDSVFQIGSITKVWTATVVMGLIDEGALTLDTPVAEIVPELRLADPEVTKAVTVRHLLTHTSGIDGDVFTDTGRGDDCIEKYVELLEEVGQNHPLGVTFSYCNSGYSLLGRVIEKVTGLTWDQALRERLFTPLGLTGTSTLPEEALLSSAAVGHHDGTPVRTWMLPRAIGPAGLINSTAADVLAFARAHLTGGLISAGSAAEMAAFQADLPDKQILGDSWGLGWIRFDWDGHRLIGHDGTTLGQAAFLRILPSAGLAVVLLTNGGHGRDLYEELFREIFGELAGVRVPRPFAPGTYDGDVTPYVGTYERAGVRMEVEADPPRLRTTIIGPLAELEPDTVDEYTLVPAGPAVFAVKPPEAENWMPVTFYTLPTGEPYLHFGVRATPKVG